MVEFKFPIVVYYFKAHKFIALTTPAFQYSYSQIWSIYYSVSFYIHHLPILKRTEHSRLL